LDGVGQGVIDGVGVILEMGAGVCVSVAAVAADTLAVAVFVIASVGLFVGDGSEVGVLVGVAFTTTSDATWVEITAVTPGATSPPRPGTQAARLQNKPINRQENILFIAKPPTEPVEVSYRSLSLSKCQTVH